ncbi:unnamed protein product [Periconia digitata]|uniref:Uncharacterized protein n=1 Tax=Periconia digitata TaxID=1303443 RepID=A0A9W4U9H2_9PLEO|nr:unnamed protein product [Periconia digitata]
MHAQATAYLDMYTHRCIHGFALTRPGHPFRANNEVFRDRQGCRPSRVHRLIFLLAFLPLIIFAKTLLVRPKGHSPAFQHRKTNLHTATSTYIYTYTMHVCLVIHGPSPTTFAVKRAPGARG